MKRSTPYTTVLLFLWSFLSAASAFSSPSSGPINKLTRLLPHQNRLVSRPLPPSQPLKLQLSANQDDVESNVDNAEEIITDKNNINDEDPLEDMEQARKRNLFQCLLRDLQIEGSPLLECDVFQAHTLQAALWTTMAELSEQDDSQKVCLVLEGIGVDALQTFVDDFLVLKTQSRLMDHLSELQRISISVVGKGVGPAIVIETADKSTFDLQRSTSESSFEEPKVTAAMKSFVDRVVAGHQVCPYTKSALKAPEGLEDVKIYAGPIGYRYSGFSEVCHILSAFWNCVCELLSVSDDKLSSVVLSMPALGSNSNTGEDSSAPTPLSTAAAHDRFFAVAELVSRSLCLFRGDDVFEILHFYPEYDRDLVIPEDKPAHGHLPPMSWLRPMLRQAGHLEEASSLSDDDLRVSNFQRRSPFTGLVIKRVSHFGALAGSSNEIVELELDDGIIEKASGVPSYARNIIKLASEGQEKLQTALQVEIASGQ